MNIYIIIENGYMIARIRSYTAPSLYLPVIFIWGLAAYAWTAMSGWLEATEKF